MDLKWEKNHFIDENVIRAALDKGLMKWIKINGPDIVCIQETKARPEQIDETIFSSQGYKSYLYSSQKKGIQRGWHTYKTNT